MSSHAFWRAVTCPVSASVTSTVEACRRVGRSRRFRSSASAATRKLKPDMAMAAQSGRSWSPRLGSKIPAVIGGGNDTVATWATGFTSTLVTPGWRLRWSATWVSLKRPAYPRRSESWSRDTVGSSVDSSCAPGSTSRGSIVPGGADGAHGNCPGLLIEMPHPGSGLKVSCCLLSGGIVGCGLGGL